MIDRDKLLDDILSWQKMLNKKNVDDKIIFTVLDTVREIIEDQEDVDDWIPVDEKLPDNFLENCLVTLENSAVFQGWYSCIGNEFRTIYNQRFSENNKVIAWKPLPIGYQGGNNE